METTKAVILKEDREYQWVICPGGSESTAQVAQTALCRAAEKAEVLVKDIRCIVATGVGRKYITFGNQELPEFLCLAKGIDFLLPSTTTLLDLGARKSLAVKCSGGRAMKFVSSGKCAAGTGTFLEVAANILRINICEMDELYFKSNKYLEIQSTCAVFAESEIISLIHSNEKAEDIVRGVFRGLAGRIYSQLLELGVENDVTVVGGVAKSKAMIAALEERVGFKLLVPENPEIVGALGAALIAQEARSAMS